MCSDQTAEGTMLPLISNLVVITNESFFIRSGSHFVGCHGNVDVNIKSPVHVILYAPCFMQLLKNIYTFSKRKRNPLYLCGTLKITKSKHLSLFMVDPHS